jgi:hypothetical protein
MNTTAPCNEACAMAWVAYPDCKKCPCIFSAAVASARAPLAGVRRIGHAVLHASCNGHSSSSVPSIHMICEIKSRYAASFDGAVYERSQVPPVDRVAAGGASLATCGEHRAPASTATDENVRAHARIRVDATSPTAPQAGMAPKASTALGPTNPLQILSGPEGPEPALGRWSK